MPEPINPEISRTPEQAETKPEAAVEHQEAGALEGAQMLEVPSDGSFIHGLQVFVAWAKSLLANDSKD